MVAATLCRRMTQKVGNDRSMDVDLTALTILIIVFVLVLAIRAPVALAMGASSIAAAAYLGLPATAVGQQMVYGLISFPLLAIPFFLLAGEIMVAGGAARRLIALATLLVGWMRGGLAMVNVATSTLLGGISGSAVADTSAVGSVLIPMMRKAGYDADYSVAVTVSSSAQGILIPPSHNMIIYSLAAGGVSIGALFAGGLIPGLILGTALMVTSYVIARRKGYPKGESISIREAPRIILGGLSSLTTLVIIVGGILSGIFTATESAAIACGYAFLLTFLVYREIPVSHTVAILRRTARTLSLVVFLLATGSVFGYVITLMRVPAALATTLTELSDSRIVILLTMNALLLALGMVMEMGPLILIMTPLLLPVATTIGMDPVHFGVMLVFNLSLALITPPIGAALFVGCSIAGVSIEQVAGTIIPFLISMVAVLLLITFAPSLVMGLPNALGF